MTLINLLVLNVIIEPFQGKASSPAPCKSRTVGRRAQIARLEVGWIYLAVSPSTDTATVDWSDNAVDQAGRLANPPILDYIGHSSRQQQVLHLWIEI